jgi:hypothetical protein
MHMLTIRCAVSWKYISSYICISGAYRVCNFRCTEQSMMHIYYTHVQPDRTSVETWVDIDLRPLPKVWLSVRQFFM